MPQLLTKKELAAHWRVSEGTVDEWMRKHKVEVIRTPGGYPRFRQPETDEPMPSVEADQEN